MAEWLKALAWKACLLNGRWVPPKEFLRKNPTTIRIFTRSRLFTVYVLKSVNYKYHYIGHTKDVKGRLKQHNMGRVKVSKAHIPYTLIYLEEYETRSDAVRRERELKKGKGNFWLRNKLTKLDLW